MSLDVYLIEMQPTQVFESNITHNLGKMAKEAGLYEYLWEPEKLKIYEAGNLIAPLTIGLQALAAFPEKFSKFDAANGWGTYKDFIQFVTEYLDACKKHPNARIGVSR